MPPGGRRHEAPGGRLLAVRQPATTTEWLDAYEGLRVAAARLLGARPSEIALVKNTSEGIATVALGSIGSRAIAWWPSRRNFRPIIFLGSDWKQRGFGHLAIRGRSSRTDRRSLPRRAKLLAISFVQFLSGYRAPIQEIGEICHRNRCIFLVDAIQGLGAFPLDVRACHIDALAADGHKWLLGPEGCGILYINRALQDRVEPVEFGWTNVAGYNDYASRDMALRQDAGRYECGTLNTIGCFGLRASIEFLLEVGAGKIAPVVQNLGDRIAEGVLRKGCELAGRSDSGKRRRNRFLQETGHGGKRDRAETGGRRNQRGAARGLGANLPALLYSAFRYRPDDRGTPVAVRRKPEMATDERVHKRYTR